MFYTVRERLTLVAQWSKTVVIESCQGFSSFNALTVLFALALALLVFTPSGLTSTSSSSGPKGPQEVVSMRTARSETFIDQDGRYHTRVYTQPIHYRQAGTWRPIDNSLAQSDRKGFRYQNAANSFHVHFKDSLDDGFMRFEAPSGKARVEVSLEKADDVSALKRSSREISYRGFRKQADIRYDVTADGVKETIVLEGADAPSSYVFNIQPDKGDDLRAAKQPDGGIAFFAEGDQKASFSIAAPIVADSSKEGEANPPAPGMASMEIEKREDGSFRLEVSIDPKWLEEPARVFPVYLDPSYNTSSQSDGYYISKIGTTPIPDQEQDGTAIDSATSNPVGYTYSGSPYYGYRSYVYKSAAKFDLSAIPIGSSVLSVLPSLFLDGYYHRADCPSCAFDGTVYWYGLPSPWSAGQTWSQVKGALNGTALASGYFHSSYLINARYAIAAAGGLPAAVQQKCDIDRSVSFLLSGPESGGAFTFSSSRRGESYAPMLNIAWVPSGSPTPGITTASLLSAHPNGAELSWSVWGGVYPSKIAQDAPSLYYRLNEDADSTSAFDSSGKELTGSYTDVTLNQVGAVPGGDRARSFNGSGSYAVTPRVTPLEGNGSETVEVWFKPSAPGVIVDELGQQERNTGWHDTALEIVSSVGCPGTGEVYARVWGVSPISLGCATYESWHHAVLRYNATTRILDGFLDGNKFPGVTGTRSTPWTNGYGQYFALGAADSTNLNSGAWFNGSLDEFALYDRPLEDEAIRAHWKAGVYQRYEIHRSQTSGFTPGASTLVATLNDPAITTYRDTTAAAGTFYYRIVAPTSSTLGPSISDPVQASLPTWNAQTDDPRDRPTGPQVAISSPAPSARVTDASISVVGAASDDGKVASVQFKLDGSNLGSAVTSPPFQTSWSTTGYAYGSQHTLTAVATDNAGNTTSSSPVSVTVANSAAPTDVTVTVTDSGRSANLIANSGFEASLDGWDSWQADLSRSSDVSHSGVWSAKATSTVNDGFSVSSPYYLSGATAGRTFTVSAWIYVPSGSDLIGKDLTAIARADGGANPVSEEGSTRYSIHAGWQEIGAAHTIQENDRDAIRFIAYVESEAIVGDVFYLDDAEMHELSEMTFSASASDDSGVDHIDFLVDGKRFASDGASPWAAALNTLTLPLYDGSPEITARAFDSDGNATTSAVLPITVANAAGTEYLGTIQTTTDVPSEMTSQPLSNPDDGPYGTPLLDDANRSNGDPGPNWTGYFFSGESKPVVDTNAFDAQTGWHSMVWNPGMFGGEQEVWAKVDWISWQDALYLGATQTDLSSGGSAYWVSTHQEGASHWQVGKVVNGDFTVLAEQSGGPDFASGDYVALVRLSDHLELWRRADGAAWEKLTNVADDSLTANGYLALEIAGGTRYDDIGGGTITAGSNPQLTNAPLKVTLHNTSEQTWAASNVKLRYRWLNPDGNEFSRSGNLPIGGDLAADASRDDVPVTVSPPKLPASVMRGRFTLRIDLYDTANSTYFAAKGNAPFEKTVTVTRVQPDELGLERYQQYDGTDLGSGFGASVNLANGNLVVNSTLSKEPGIGLDTVVGLTYNSLENGSVSPAGNNWSLSISGLTPFGLPLDIHPNEWIGFTDGDGTYHRFTKTAGNNFYDAPAGVHLYLRPVTSPDPARWALTKPDRTTFYYNSQGFPIFVKDKDGNTITFTESAATDDINGLTEHVTSVTDAGSGPNRSYQISYFDRTGAQTGTSRPNLWGKVFDISDHVGHKWVFAYYDDGNLQSITEQGGTNADGSYLPDRTVSFSYTSREGTSHAPGLDTLADRKNPTPAQLGVSQSTRLYSVIDARGHETKFSYTHDDATNPWRLYRVTNRNDVVSSSYAYDFSDPDDSKTTVTFTPDSGGQLPRTWHYSFDGQGRMTSFKDPVTGPLNKATQVEWSLDNNVTKLTEPNGKDVQYAYNQNGYQTMQRDELGNTTTTVFQDAAVDENDPSTSLHLSRVSSVTKPLGNTWTFEYTNPVNPESCHVTTAAGTPSDNVCRVVDPSGAVSTNEYNSNGTLAAQTQPAAGDSITRTTVYNLYDNNGLPTQVTDAGGNVSRAGYDDTGSLLWQEDPNHGSYTGASFSQPCSATDSLYLSCYYYDSYGRVGRTSSPKSTSLYPGVLIWDDTRYDANDNVVEDLNAHYGAGDSGVAASATTAYDALDRPTEATSQRGAKTQTVYDDAGRVSRVVKPNGYGQSQGYAETDTSYDQLDRARQVTQYASGQDARTTTYCYDLAGDLRSATAPKGSTLGMDCPAIDADPYVYTSAGFTTKLEYDAAHRQLRQIAPDDTSTHVEYDAGGQVVKSWDQTGAETDTTYNNRGLPTKTVEPFDGARKITTLTEYDPLGRVKRQISPRAYDTLGPDHPSSDYVDYVTTYQYDALSRRVTTLLPKAANESQRYIHEAYDANGNQTLVTLATAASDARSTSPYDKTSTVYLDTGSIYSTLDGSTGYTTRYDYTAEGWQSVRLPDLATALGSIDLSKQIRWDYKPDGLQAMVTDPQGQHETYSYDPDGNQTQAIEASGGSAMQIDRTFNGFDELTQTSAPDPTYSNLLRNTSYAYDRDGNTTQETVGLAGDPGRSFNYSYNQLDQVVTQTDDFGTPSSPADDEKATYSYTFTGELSSRALSKAAGSDWQLEQRSDTTYFDNGLTKTEQNYAGASATLVEQHTLSYLDENVYENGNKTHDSFRLVGPDASASCRNDSCNTWWQYDGQERLVHEYPGSGDATDFTLNAAGDVTSQQTGSTTTPSTYIGHRLYTQRGSDGIVMRFIYDSNGNLACKVPDASWTSTVCPSYTTWPTRNAPIDLESYSYDYKNRLTTYRRYGIQGQLIDYTAYTYDALDRSVVKSETHYADDGWGDPTTTTTNSSYEGDSSRVIEEYLVGLEKKTYAYDAFGSAISLSSKPNSQAPASRYSYLYDPGSSVSLLVDSQGAVQESYGYSAYGSSNGAISKKASGFSTGSVPTNPVRFQGKMFDSGSGSYDMGARRYSASSGRWFQQDFYADALDNLGLSQDPLTANRYAFLGANPVNYVEFDGHRYDQNPYQGAVDSAQRQHRAAARRRATQSGSTGPRLGVRPRQLICGVSIDSDDYDALVIGAVATATIYYPGSRGNEISAFWVKMSGAMGGGELYIGSDKHKTWNSKVGDKPFQWVVAPHGNFVMPFRVLFTNKNVQTHIKIGIHSGSECKFTKKAIR